MKARVKATGEIVEVHTSDNADYVDRNGKYYWEHELFFGSLDVSSYDDPDYWTRLEHQYAGMAMQGICANPSYDEASYATMADVAIRAARALVQELKEKEERK